MRERCAVLIVPKEDKTFQDTHPQCPIYFRTFSHPIIPTPTLIIIAGNSSKALLIVERSTNQNHGRECSSGSSPLFPVEWDMLRDIVLMFCQVLDI
jgi:hypothetical protein